MRGKSHLITNTATVVLLADCSVLLKDVYTGVGHEQVKSVIDNTTKWFQDVGSLNPFLFVGLSVFFFWLGSLLPDIDSPYSTLGKIIHIPVKHRTWMHTIWFVIAFLIGSIWFRPLIWLAFGFFLHLFWDNFSMSGICFIYPIIKYRKHHPLKLYTTSEMSETAVVLVVVGSTVILTILLLCIGCALPLVKILFGYLPFFD